MNEEKNNVGLIQIKRTKQGKKYELKMNDKKLMGIKRKKKGKKS